jgi:hypothetical protein
MGRWEILIYSLSPDLCFQQLYMAIQGLFIGMIFAK